MAGVLEGAWLSGQSAAGKMQERVLDQFHESIELARESQVLAPAIVEAGRALAACLAEGGMVLCCGNGGSAADAQHFSGELLGRFETERPGLAAVTLSTDTSALTAIANDYAYADVFAKQVRALGRKGDALFAITTSGNSENVVRAVKTAHERGIAVVALTGRDGGAMAGVLDEGDIEIRVPGHRTSRIQEVHGLIIHCICDLVDAELIGA